MLPFTQFFAPYDVIQTRLTVATSLSPCWRIDSLAATSRIIRRRSGGHSGIAVPTVVLADRFMAGDTLTQPMVRLHTRGVGRIFLCSAKTRPQPCEGEKMQWIRSGSASHKKTTHVQFFAVHSGEDKSVQKNEEIDSQETSVEYGLP